MAHQLGQPVPLGGPGPLGGFGVDDRAGKVVALRPGVGDMAATFLGVGLGAVAEHPHPGRGGAQVEFAGDPVLAVGLRLGAQHLALGGSGALAGFLVAVHQRSDLLGGQDQAEGVGHGQLRRVRRRWRRGV